ncbi:MAG: hypothetical protein ACI4QI_00410 [Candidatus Coproplasma sp.]
MKSAINVSYKKRNGNVTDQTNYIYDSEAEFRKFSEVNNFASEGFDTVSAGSSSGLAYVDGTFIYKSLENVNGYEGYTLAVQGFEGLESNRAVEYSKCFPAWVKTGISQDTLEAELPHPENWLFPASSQLKEASDEQRRIIALIVDKLLNIKLKVGKYTSIQIKGRNTTGPAMLVRVLRCLPLSLSNQVSFKIGGLGFGGKIDIFYSPNDEMFSDNNIYVADIDSSKFREEVKRHTCENSYAEYLIEAIKCLPEMFDDCRSFEELNGSANRVLFTQDLENGLSAISRDALMRIVNHCKNDIWKQDSGFANQLGEIAFRVFFTRDYVYSNKETREFFEGFLVYAPEKEYNLSNILSVIKTINGTKGKAEYLQALVRCLDNSLIAANYKTAIREALYYIDGEGSDEKIIKTVVVEYLSNYMAESLIDDYLNDYYKINGKLSEYIVQFLGKKYITLSDRKDFLSRLNAQTSEALVCWGKGWFITSVISDISSFKILAKVNSPQGYADNILMAYLNDKGFFSDQNNSFKMGINCAELKAIATSLKINTDNYNKIVAQCDKIKSARELANGPVRELSGKVVRRQTNLSDNFPIVIKTKERRSIFYWEEACKKERNIKEENKVKKNAFGSCHRIFFESLLALLICLIVDAIVFFVPWIEMLVPLNVVAQMIGIIKYIVLVATVIIWVIALSLNIYRLKKQQVASKDLAKTAFLMMLRLWSAVILLAIIVLLIAFVA